MTKVGILHPGEMGVSVAATAINSGHEVYWLPKGRSAKSWERAKKNGLMSVTSLSKLCHTCEIMLSVCPPHAAQEVAQSVIDAGFKGLFLDANAISPQRTSVIRQLMEAANIRFVDGGIIGGPAWTPNETWLYLSGEYAQEVAACFSAGPLSTKIIGTEIGKASALKMCYAAYSKGTTALLASVLAAAESHGVRRDLYEEWDREEPGFSEHVNKRVTGVTFKAWRFEGEMKEIAATFREAGLPGEFHDAATEIYQRMASLLNNNGPVQTVEQLLAAMIDKEN